MTAPAPPANFSGMLAIELFRRVATSMTMGAIGVAVVYYAHWGAADRQLSIDWLIFMLVVFAARIEVARRGLRVARSGGDAERYVNQQAVLCAVTGLGWGGTIYLFDSGVMDQMFNLRLIVIAAAIAFTVSSMAVFKRVCFSYLGTLSIPVLIFLITHDYVRPWNYLFPSGVFYIGMIALVSANTNRHIRKATADHLQVLALTERLQQALDIEKQLRDELDKRANTDELTAIFNRRGLMTQLNIELARCRRFTHSIAALMIDIDHFKQVNDNYGHAGGDTAITVMVAAVQQQLRDTDIFGRMGGEEFLLLLPEIDQANAIAVAERIRERIANTDIAFPARTIRITVSIGVATYRADDDADSLLARADDALYVAKDSGRNRVEVEG